MEPIERIPSQPAAIQPVNPPLKGSTKKQLSQGDLRTIKKGLGPQDLQIKTEGGSYLKKHFSYSHPTPYPNLKYTDELFEDQINAEWKNEFVSKPSILSQPVIKKELYKEIQVICSKSIAKNITYDSLFLASIKHELILAKTFFECIAGKCGKKTKAGEFFFSHLNLLIHSEDFTTFITRFENFKKEKHELYQILKIFLGFKGKDLLKKISKWYGKSRSEFQTEFNKVQQLWEKSISLAGKKRLSIRTLSIDIVDKIPRPDVVRCIAPDKLANLPIKINKKEITPMNNSFFQGIIHQINSKYYPSMKNLPDEQSEEEKLRADQPIPCERILKLCTNNIWCQAEIQIRSLFKAFYEIPFRPQYQQGIRAKITITDKYNYTVSQIKSLAVYKRRVADDDSCFVIEGHPIGWLTLKWCAHFSFPELCDELVLNEWKLNPESLYEDQLLFLKCLNDLQKNLKELNAKV